MVDIIQKDCIKGIKELNEEFDIIIADPPYNIGKEFGNYKDNLSLEDYLNWSDEWINVSLEKLKKSGTMFIYGVPEILAYIAVRLKYDFRWLTWHYTNKTTPSLKFWQRSSESILCIWKDKDKRIFNTDLVREEYTEKFLKNSAGKKRTNTKGRFGNKETVYKANDKGALPRDVLKVSALAGGAGAVERIVYCKDCDIVGFASNMKEHKEHDILKHPTQKPMDLTQRLILSAMVDDCNILVPFSGSGSELYVIKELGFNGTGFEIDDDFYYMGKKLIKD